VSTHADYHSDHLAVLATLAEHLTTFDLPHGIASTEVRQELVGHRVIVQLNASMLPDLAIALLAWADTLTGVTAQAWRTPSGDSVHLTVTGRLADGSPVEVYSGLPHELHVFGPYLEPGDQQTIPLGLLREWADLLGFREAA
jgi:hypothetical protein